MQIGPRSQLVGFDALRAVAAQNDRASRCRPLVLVLVVEVVIVSCCRLLQQLPWQTLSSCLPATVAQLPTPSQCRRPALRRLSVGCS